MRKALATVVLLACAPAEPPAGEARPYAYRPCDYQTRVGEFRLDLSDSATSFAGSVRTGVVPAQVPEEVARSGDCRLLRKRHLECTPGCTAAQTCGDGARCVPFPGRTSVGEVTVLGLARPVVLAPAGSNLYFDTTLPHPAFRPGDVIELRTSGAADVSRIALVGRGIAPMQLEGPSELPLDPTRSLVVTWPAGDGQARVRVLVDIDQHAVTPARLECDVADSGRVAIPAELVARLVALGVSGGPFVRVARQTVDSARVKFGCVELVVASEAHKELVLPHLP